MDFRYFKYQKLVFEIFFFKKKKKVSPRFELGLLDSKSNVLTITL